MTPQRVEEIWEGAVLKRQIGESSLQLFARLLANEVREECAQLCEKQFHEYAMAEAIRATKQTGDGNG